jgi:hypothetical protein
MSFCVFESKIDMIGGAHHESQPGTEHDACEVILNLYEL